MLKIYNTLTQKKEEFIPIRKGKVGIYGCGVTPYKPSHLGHAMQGIIFDIMRRYLEYKGYDVTYVRNYTDIEDRIIERAKEANMQALDYSQMIIDQCDKDFDALRVRRADYTPKVSEFIPEIIKAIGLLIKKGYAYETNKGNVYYSIAKFPEYGKLSKRKLDEMRVGVRKKVESDKQNAMDFALWKTSKEGEISWDSPWGKGRPGWHIECSVMSSYHLGKHFDIHGGGGDLLFPHHENEIAQSEALNDGKFVNYWVHNGLLMVGNKKMSKSLNNDVSIQDWLKRYHPEIIRYLILTNHYRSHVQFVPERYVEATKKVYQTYKTIKAMHEYLGYVLSEFDGDKWIQLDEFYEKNIDEVLYRGLINEFERSMDNDFNTVQVIAKFHEIVGKINTLVLKESEENKLTVATYHKYFDVVSKVMGIFDLEPEIVLKEIEDLHLLNNADGLERKTITMMLVMLNEARKKKDYKTADTIRSTLGEKGIAVIYNDQGGSRWELAF